MQEELAVEGKTAKGSIGFLVAAFFVAFLVMVLVPMWFALDVVGSGGAHVHGGAKISQEWFTSKINHTIVFRASTQLVNIFFRSSSD